jgi:hypothetical protein
MLYLLYFEETRHKLEHKASFLLLKAQDIDEAIQSAIGRNDYQFISWGEQVFRLEASNSTRWVRQLDFGQDYIVRNKRIREQ